MMELSTQEHQLLKQKLNRLAASIDTYSKAGHRLVAAGRNARLEAILTEIDDSMLSESLTFRVGSAALDVSVAGRRFLGVTHADGLDVDADVLGKAVSPEDDTHMNTIRSVMTGLADLDGDLFVNVGAKAKLGDGATIGVSTGQLRKAWGLVVDLPELVGDSPLEMLLNGLGDDVVANLLVRSGSVASQAGPDDHQVVLTSILEDQLMEFSDWRDTHASGHGEPSLTCILNAGPDGTALVVAKHGDDVSLFTIAAESAPKAHVIWRQIEAI